MDCSEVRDQLGDYVDNEMLAEICRELEAHLKHCRDCRVEVDSIRKTIVLYQAESGKRLEVPVRVTERLQEALAQEYRKGDRVKID